MKYTIIITCYNREKLISRSIRSALHQKNIDRTEYEIIVIDDFSSDSSLEKIQEFDSLIKIIKNKKNLGLSKSRNKTIKASKGKYILMLDSDDYIAENFLHFMGSFLDYNTHWYAAASDYYKVNLKEEILKRYSFSKNPIACGILYRRKSIFDVGLYNGKFRALEDKEFRFKYLKKFKIGYVNLPLYRYTMHSKNLTKNKKEIKKYSQMLKKYEK
jgi:glycosyltransferase involved in cell wall biosynthesis